ncbi:MAG TPA: DUF1156 domain-containing protein, partial [Armatimonadota bacterium]|nr:DUF1156 domain-containing protein [Armatimonadota bacterium]
MTSVSPEGRSFIEVQFPVAQVSAESYKERKAGASQTLTGLGKWWGRKPLVMVRAALLGLLLPATADPQKDREIFFKLMTMDRDGLWRRKNRAISQTTLIEYLRHMPPSVRRRFLGPSGTALQALGRQERGELERLVFEQMPYSEKIQYCLRPEQIEGPSPEAWAEINAYLGTDAHSLAELVQALGRRRFGRTPRVGDAFCGGGSIPFEAARLGCEVFASDLNPMAAFLTWSALHLLHQGERAMQALRAMQEEIIKEVDRQIVEWGIEQNAQGWRAD